MCAIAYALHVCEMRVDWDENAPTADEQLEWEDNWDDEEDDDDFAKRLRAELAANRK